MYFGGLGMNFPKHLLLTLVAAAFIPLLQTSNQQFGFVQIQDHVQDFIAQSLRLNYELRLSAAQFQCLFGALICTYYLCGIAGILIAQFTKDLVGRRPLLFVATPALDVVATAFLISARLTGRFELLFVCRCFGGLAVGIQIGSFYPYLSEMSPPTLRIVSYAMAMCFVQFGILITFLIGIPQLLGSEKLWHYVTLPTTLLAPVQVLLFFFVHESPKVLYMFRKNCQDSALEVIKRMHGDLVDTESSEMAYKFEAQQLQQRIGVKQIYADDHLRSLVLMQMALSATRAVSGAILLNQYSYTLLTAQLGFTKQTGHSVVVGVGFALFVFSALMVFVQNRFPRRPLILGGLYVSLTASVVFVLCNVAPGSVGQSAMLVASAALLALVQITYPVCLAAFTYVSPNRIPYSIRSMVRSLSTGFDLFLRALLFFLFPILQHSVGVGVLLIICTLPTLVLAIYLTLKLPETKNLPVTDAFDRLTRRKSSTSFFTDKCVSPKQTDLTSKKSKDERRNIDLDHA